MCRIDICFLQYWLLDIFLLFQINILHVYFKEWKTYFKIWIDAISYSASLPLNSSTKQTCWKLCSSLCYLFNDREDSPESFPTISITTSSKTLLQTSQPRDVHFTTTHECIRHWYLSSKTHNIPLKFKMYSPKVISRWKKIVL